jgi:hypothetical protein
VDLTGRRSFLYLKGGGWISRETWNRLCKPVLAVANVGPNCSICGGPLKVIVRSKTRTNAFVQEHSLDEKLK